MLPSEVKEQEKKRKLMKSKAGTERSKTKAVDKLKETAPVIKLPADVKPQVEKRKESVVPTEAGKTVGLSSSDEHPDEVR